MNSREIIQNMTHKISKNDHWEIYSNPIILKDSKNLFVLGRNLNINREKDDFKFYKIPFARSSFVRKLHIYYLLFIGTYPPLFLYIITKNL